MGLGPRRHKHSFKPVILWQKSIHKNHKIAQDNRAHSLVAKTQYLIIFDKQVETKISGRFDDFEYHCFDPYHKWFNIIESSEYPAFYSPSKIS